MVHMLISSATFATTKSAANALGASGSPAWRRRTGRASWRAVLLAVAAASPSPADCQILDRGAFVLRVDGAEVGVERFSIHRQGTGGAQVIVAASTIAMHDGRTLTTSLRLAGPEMAPSEYSVMVVGVDTTAVRVVRAGRRLRSRKVDSTGEEERAYPIRGASVILEEGVAHHYFALAGLEDASDAHALVPLQGRQRPAARIERAPETIGIGGGGDRDHPGAAWVRGRGLVRPERRPG